MLETELGIEMESNEEHLMNALWPMNTTELESVIEVNLKHPENAFFSIDLTESGIAIEVNDPHPWNAVISIAAIVFGITTEVNEDPKKHRHKFQSNYLEPHAHRPWTVRSGLLVIFPCPPAPHRQRRSLGCLKYVTTSLLHKKRDCPWFPRLNSGSWPRSGLHSTQMRMSFTSTEL